MYSAFVLDMAVLFCFFDDQLTNLSPNSCILPDVLFLVSWQPAWSASTKAVRAMQESFEYHRPIFMVPLRQDELVFSRIRNRDIVSYNVMRSTYFENGEAIKGLGIFGRM
ncbi:hypothetical protein Tco_0775515 [Tanacetum coccineum]